MNECIRFKSKQSQALNESENAKSVFFYTHSEIGVYFHTVYENNSVKLLSKTKHNGIFVYSGSYANINFDLMITPPVVNVLYLHFHSCIESNDHSSKYS